MTVIQEGVGYAANNRGLVGGSILTDPANFIEQAALFEKGKVKLIPRQPNEFIEVHVVKLTDSGIALIASLDLQGFEKPPYLYWHGRSIPVNRGPNQTAFLDVNEWGLVSGTEFDPVGPPYNDHAFRFVPPSGPKVFLNPLPTEASSWGMGINNRGDVLGYSFHPGALERIGVWRGRKFYTYFVEGVAPYPTVSNRLLWNELGVIVITRVTSGSDQGNSYLVPGPGVRIKLSDVTDRFTRWTDMTDVNNKGDMIGFGGNGPYFQTEDDFLLLRVDGRAPITQTQ